MKVFVLIFVLAWVTYGRTQDTMSFNNPKEMADYAFSSTDFSLLQSPFLINRSMEMEADQYRPFVKDEQSFVKGESTIGLFGALEWWDTRGIFKRDSVLFPVFEHFSMMDEEQLLYIPLFVTDMNTIRLNAEVWENFRASADIAPFPAITSNDVSLLHFETASIFLDSFAYNSAFIRFDASTFISNTGRIVDHIVLRSNGDERVLYPGSPVNVSEWLGGQRTIEIEVSFTDGSSFVKSQEVDWNGIPKPKSLSEPFWNTVSREYYDSESATNINNPVGEYTTWYACPDRKLRKPFLFVAGWGAHTDKPLINNFIGMPTPFPNLVQQFNQEGLIEQLHAQGFDVVVVKFNPPNASILKNSAVLEKIINKINATKTTNGSYEENVIMGFSAGALATKLTLQIMEKKHLEQGGRHPHTKLFISNDGENLGANVPLGMQHAVKYLYNYEYNAIFSDYKTYGLNYVLNAPLSRELLFYFHSATGYGNNPGQGCDVMRTAYMQYHNWNNHSKNTHIPGYPSFQRNVSISNGSSTPKYNFSDYSCDHPPYPEETGKIFFKQSGSMMGWVNRRYEATFLRHGVSRVFYYEYKPLFKGWRVAYEAKTKNPLVVDNAPGGIIFIRDNPIININSELRKELTGAPDIALDLLFSFTPTVLTHDFKDFNQYVVNGYPDYNMKNRGLLYNNEESAALNNPNEASDFFGFPHLKYPTSHYNIVPFDAVFSWSQNTEHLTGNRKADNEYAPEGTAVKPVVKNFIVDEAEWWNIFLQNKRIGYYARPDFQYRVDYEARNGVYLGNHVTQKTDFVEMTSEPNAIVEVQAGTEIVFKPGVHLKHGTTFHAFIGDITCEKSAAIGTGGDTPDYGSPNYSAGRKAEESAPVVYPNPAKGSFAVAWESFDPNTPVSVAVYSLEGKQLFNCHAIVNSEIKHDLRPGIYLVSIQHGTQCYSRKIVVE